MRVIFDISILGLGHQNTWARTGVFRATEGMLQALAEEPRLTLGLYYGQTLQEIHRSIGYKVDSVDGRNVAPAPLGFYRQYEFLHAQSYDQILGFRRALRGERWAGFRKEFSLRACLIASRYSDEIFKRYFAVRQSRQISHAQIYHSPWYAVPEAFHANREIHRFLTIYDLIPVLYPQWVTPENRAWFDSLLKSITPEDWLMCISEATKNDLCRYADVDPGHVFVTHLAASQDLFYPCQDAERLGILKRRLGIPEGDYFLCVNTMEPRKNMRAVVSAFAQLAHDQPAAQVSLVMVGAKGWMSDDLYASIAQLAVAKERIVITGYVPDEDLAPLYSGALAFVYPSFAEGFGLPVLEAMQCGTPVITSDSSSLPEVVGDAGITIDPADVDALSQSMWKLCRDAALRRTLSVKSMERAKQFTWKKCSQQIMTAYRAALSD